MRVTTEVFGDGDGDDATDMKEPLGLPRHLGELWAAACWWTLKTLVVVE
jgi:hypothetical protein